MLVELAIIIMLESSGNPTAHNKKSDARGLCQITPVVLEEYNRKYNTNFKKKWLFDPEVNKKIAKWYLNKRIPQMLKTFDIPVTLENVLISWNAGVRYCIVARLGVSKRIPKETKEFIRRYKEINDDR